MSNPTTIVRYGNAVNTIFEVPGSLNKTVYVGGVLTTPASTTFQSVTLSVAPGAGIPVEIEYDSEVIPTAGVAGSSPEVPGVFFGTGDPTITAPKGSLYMRTDATTTITRMYVNTTGAAVWATVTTSA